MVHDSGKTRILRVKSDEDVVYGHIKWDGKRRRYTFSTHGSDLSIRAEELSEIAMAVHSENNRRNEANTRLTWKTGN